MTSRLDRPTPDELARALRRLVFTDKLLTLDTAHRYCTLAGLPPAILSDTGLKPPMEADA